MASSCGYCGYPLNTYELLKCAACDHSPWWQGVPYTIKGRSGDLDELIKFLDLEKVISEEYEEMLYDE
jgi:hypothetical protein